MNIVRMESNEKSVSLELLDGKCIKIFPHRKCLRIQFSNDTVNVTDNLFTKIIGNDEVNIFYEPPIEPIIDR